MGLSAAQPSNCRGTQHLHTTPTHTPHVLSNTPQQQQQQAPIMEQQQKELDPTYLPFIRTDRYGEGGWVISFWAKARLLLLACTLLPVRLISGLSCVAAFYVTCRLVTLIPNELVARRVTTACGKLWSRACLFCLGFVYIRWTRPAAATGKPAKHRSVAVVSNHCGWVDILIHMARYFPAFVARDGTQNLAMVGLISQRMQCIYVDREKKGGNNTSNSNSNSNSRPTTPPQSTGAAAGTPADAGSAAAAVAESLGVSGQVKQRMLLTQQHPELELRPMLLFPEGTTTNGRFLLPFKTGAFLAGVPVLPTIIHYRCGSAADDRSSRHSSLRSRALAAAAVAVAAAMAAAVALAAGGSQAAAGIAAVAAAAAAAVLVSGALSGKGGVSPCWESMDATRHLLLMLCQPFHTVECYELPLYQPSPEEAADPRLYAANVRDYMLRQSAAVMGPAALKLSAGLLEDKRRYQAWMRARRAQIEEGQGLTTAVFKTAGSKAAGAGKQQQQRSATAVPTSSNGSSSVIGGHADSSSIAPPVVMAAAT